MNERIRQFAIDCAGQLEWDSPKDPASFTFNRAELEKFYKLIVEECAGVELYWLSEQDRKSVAEKIKSNFGVE